MEQKPNTKPCFWWWNHDWGKWIIYATSGADIYLKRICSKCGDVQTKVV